MSTIPVPDSFGVLAPSTCLMHAWGAPQSLLHRLDRRKLRLAHELVPASACHSAGIRAVKDAVFERRVTEHDDDDDSDIDEPPDEPLETPTEGDGSSSEGVVPVVKPPRRSRRGSVTPTGRRLEPSPRRSPAMPSPTPSTS